MITDIMINHVTPATVKNTLNFNGYSFTVYNEYIQKNIKVNSATQADIAYGIDYSTLKNNILNSVEKGETDFTAIQDKVEKEWTSYLSKNALALNGYSFSDLETYIKKNIKIDQASTADTAFGKTLDDFKNYIKEQIDSSISNVFTDSDNSLHDSLIDLITDTKVSNATNADNSTKFADKTEDDWNKVIINTKVNKAIYADQADEVTYFGGLTSSQWDNKFSDLESSLKNWTETKAIAYLANDVKNINGISIENFDDHIKDLATEVYEGETDSGINASKLEGRDTEALIDYLQTELIPDKATSSTYSMYVFDSLDGEYKFADDVIRDNLDNDPEMIYNTYQNYFYDKIFNSDVSETRLKDFRDFRRDINSFMDIFHSPNIKFWYNNKGIQQLKIIDPDALIYSTNKKEYKYDEDGNLTSEIYYLLVTSKDDDGNDIDEYLNIIQKDYNYNDDGTVSTIEFTIYSYNETDEDDDGNEIIGKLKYSMTRSFSYDDNGNLISEENTFNGAEFIKD
jgi:hypothetical protein